MITLTKENNADAAVYKLLKYLSINIDPAIICEELEKHPDYPSLLAVSDILTALKIENNALRVDYDELIDVPCPFMAHSILDGESLIVVTKLNKDFVTFSNETVNRRRVSSEDFRKQFNGIVLIAKPGENYPPVGAGLSAWADGLKMPAITTGTVIIFLSSLYYHTDYLSVLNWRLILLTLFKFAGLITSILLLIQSIDSNNPLIQMICQTNGKTNCNAILSSKAAKVFGVEWLSWSEVGFFYFASTTLLILIGGNSQVIMKILLILNIVSLPYTFYSIYYQARIAKQWCILCCTVQALLWLELIFLVSYQNSIRLAFAEDRGIVFSSVYVCLTLPMILWGILKPLFLKAESLKPLKRQLRKFKYNTFLFNKMLTSQPKFNQPDEEWSIVLGNREANNVITMVSNPYCPPCSITHMLLHQLLEGNDNLQVRIIFALGNRGNDISTSVSRHLVALSDVPGPNKLKTALNDWYEQKQKDYTSWAKAYPVALSGMEIKKIDKQNDWCEKAKVTATPTILLNGYLLPELYRVSDLKYMLE
ncbi:vitamin K epoxide reductase family protein [Mucilaginibacter gilvus]|uniref:Peptidase C39 domain-containing protein n=1 Tax=Mucilaginibacter gilvus TaxID=2305909 RepID=A0A3S3YXJ9_9SPHI|nr:vitamin K epoxide reductase family protein [Mucilaginibacter gilvus]RWY48327.1 hypothetical protein EPL05_19485 [Mucilaginibacter gilvus]